jgi:5'-3' exonuclease
MFEQPAPETEEEMMVDIFKYTERVVNMIRPRKLLFMAIGEPPSIRTRKYASCFPSQMGLPLVQK